MLELFGWFTAPVLIVVFWIIQCIKILNEYERGVVFRLGRMLRQPLGPGLTLILFPIDRLIRISLRTITLDVPPQDVITNASIRIIMIRRIIWTRFRVIHQSPLISANYY